MAELDIQAPFLLQKKKLTFLLCYLVNFFNN